MQEDILTTIFRRHEAKAAHLVKPLDRAGDVIGRPTFIAAEFATRRGTIPEITTRGAVTEATAATKAAATAEVTARGTITEATAAKAAAAAEITARGAITEITARGTVPEIAAWRTIPKAAATAEFTARRARFATAFALLQLHDPRDQAPALPVGPNLAHQLVAGIWRLNACLCQG
jgi:hypothetical protein